MNLDTRIGQRTSLCVYQFYQTCNALIRFGYRLLSYMGPRTAPLSSKQARDYIRVFLSGASDEVPDKQGRVTVPAPLRQYAGLDRELAVVGAGSRAEIWDAAAWQQYLEEQEAAFSDTEEEVIPGLF